MQTDTDIKDEPTDANPVLTFAKWAVVWLIVYVAFGIYGGLFISGPQDIPAGMTWINADSAWSSTFYILRGGPRLILELNPHSQVFSAAIYMAVLVFCLYAVALAVRGKFKDKQGKRLPWYVQALVALLMAVLAAFAPWFADWCLLQKETLDFDPVADSVRLDGEHISQFRDVTHFQSHAGPAYRGSTDYYIFIEFRDKISLQIGGGEAHSDVQQVADYLNDYLVKVRL